jgi:NRAMP (natural resistance-associated macrophage protein)-like metal ion transporter
MNKISSFFKKLGPGLITGASDDDPSGIATYSQAGAQFGLAFLWTALISFPLMFAIQEICARVGLVTSKGLTGNLKEHYHPVLVISVLALLIPALVFNISADIASMAAVIQLLFPKIPIWLSSIVVSLLVGLSTIFFHYRRLVSILKYLCLSLLLYLFIPFITQPNFFKILKATLIPELHFDKNFIGVLVAILGTTISPYLFFWQSTMVAEERRNSTKPLTQKKVSSTAKDVGFGMFCSNLVMFFIILTTGTILYEHGIHDILTVEQAAKALEPLAGKFSFLLFSLGIIGTGFLALPVLSGCLSYTICTATNQKEGLDKKPKQAKLFYFLIGLAIFLGLLLNMIGFNAIKALIIAAIINCLVSPPLILAILFIANNSKIMGKKKNGRLSNTLGFLTLLVMTISSVLFLMFLFV